MFEVTGPVADGAGHKAGEDEVELCAKAPIVFKVIDVECHIGRDAARVSLMAPGKN